LRHKNGVYRCVSENLNVQLKIQWIFDILLSLFVKRNFRGACLSVEMLNGYMVRERLGTPGLGPEHMKKTKIGRIVHQIYFARSFSLPSKTDSLHRALLQSCACVTNKIVHYCYSKWANRLHNSISVRTTGLKKNCHISEQTFLLDQFTK